MPRVFVYEGREFQDPDPALTPDEVRQRMAVFMTDLANAEIQHSKQGENDVYQLIKRVGTKG